MREDRIPLVGRRDETVGWAIVDPADYGDLKQWRWTRHRMGYAQRRVGDRTVLMHRHLLGLEPGDRREADHINRNKLDNRRANLRIVTHAQNGQNQPAHGGISPLRGVSLMSQGKRKKRWRALAMVAGRRISLGYYMTEAEAGRAAAAWRRANMPFSIENEQEVG